MAAAEFSGREDRVRTGMRRAGAAFHVVDKRENYVKKGGFQLCNTVRNDLVRFSRSC